MRPRRPTLVVVGFASSVAAAAAAIPPSHPLERDPVMLLVVCATAALAVGALARVAGGWLVTALTTLIVVACLLALGVAAMLRRRWEQPDMMLAFLMVAVASLAPADYRALLGRVDHVPQRAGARRVTADGPVPDHGRLDPPPGAGEVTRLLRSDPAGPRRILNDRWLLEPGPFTKADQGGFGMLYRAVDLRQARTVAVKLASRQYGGRDDSVARLVREGDVIRQLRSPYVIRVLDTGWEAGVAYLVLEYHPAGSLAHWLERRFIIDLATAVGVTCELLRALAYLHEGVDPSVIHRDVTPRNVLIRTERPALRLLLTDFGSARRVDAHGPTADAGITIGSIFSPYYAPPELVGGDRYGWWGPETDIYGACAILYELLTGLPPYQREARRQHVEFHRLVLDPRAAPMRIGAITRGLPPVLDDILTVGLARDPSARFSRARDLLSLLEEVGQRHGRLRIPYADLRRK